MICSKPPACWRLLTFVVTIFFLARYGFSDNSGRKKAGVAHCLLLSITVGIKKFDLRARPNTPSFLIGKLILFAIACLALCCRPISCCLSRRALSDGKTHPHNQTTIRPIGCDDASTMQPHCPVGDRKAHAKAAGLALA